MYCPRHAVRFLLSHTHVTSISCNREESYGALLYAYAVAKQLDGARTLLQSMESGEVAVRPGPMCYDGFILACVRSQAWDDAVAAYKTMQKSEVTPSPAACHGILLAASRRGGRSEAKTCLEGFAASGAQLHGDGALLAVKTMLPTVGDALVTMSSIRDHLRECSKKDVVLQPESLNLVRSLRVAELEEERQPSLGLSMGVLENRRKVAWQNVLKDVIVYANAAESKEQLHHNS
jgi:pentatricopeptide repeat protein